jgi:hypothetical protein
MPLTVKSGKDGIRLSGAPISRVFDPKNISKIFVSFPAGGPLIQRYD